MEKVLIKTQIAKTIADRLEAEATRKGQSLLEYIRWVLGEHALSLPEPETKQRKKPS